MKQQNIMDEFGLFAKKMFRICSAAFRISDPECRVADPDPYPDLDWIRIRSGQWIRLLIRNQDPDQRGQKLPTKVEIF
jgi:hypothetical protein